MTSGTQKLWINPIHRSGPPAVLRSASLCLDEVQADKFLSAALAGCITETVSLKASLFAVTCLEDSIGMPKPTLFICVPVGEMTEHHEEVSFGMRECFSKLVFIKWRMGCKEKV